MLLLTDKTPDYKHIMFPGKYKTFMASGIKMSKIKDYTKKGLNALKKYQGIKNNIDRKVLDVLTKPGTQKLIQNIPYVGNTINTITTTTKKAVDKLDTYADRIKDKKLSVQDVKDDIKEIKDDLLKDKNITDALNYLKDKINSSKNLKEEEKKELLSNEKDINLEEAKNIGGRLALALLIPKDKRQKETLTIPAKYRKEFKIKQKTLSNKGGKLYKKKGEGCGGKMDKKTLLNLLTK